MKMKTCPNCGKEIPEDEGEEVVYCPKCGLNLKESVIDEEAERKEKERNIKIMKKLSKFTFNELIKRGIPREKIAIIKEDLRREFSEGNLEELPILLKDCVFQRYVRGFGLEGKNKNPEKEIICTLPREEILCIKEICPFYKAWKKS
jgi:predicted RNA-binding Zn-ribbon protein involved in translation (DUF1610 family)